MGSDESYSQMHVWELTSVPDGDDDDDDDDVDNESSVPVVMMLGISVGLALIVGLSIKAWQSKVPSGKTTQQQTSDVEMRETTANPIGEKGDDKKKLVT